MDVHNYTIQDLIDNTDALRIGDNDKLSISHLLTDSRKLVYPSFTLFVAIKGERNDGHDFIAELYDKGVKNFLVSVKVKNAGLFPDANFLVVKNTLIALQQLCSKHRERFSIPVIGITGSNGKTIVKEWLYELLQEDYHIVRSPKSYNSQLGVPLSVWGIKKDHNMAIFEAGISLPSEMEKLRKIIQPTIGIFTSIGDAHSQGFTSIDHKVLEKLNLFDGVEKLIYCNNYTAINNGVKQKLAQESFFDNNLFSWGRSDESDLKIKGYDTVGGWTKIKGIFKGENVEVEIGFTDKASIENAITCWAVLISMGYSSELIKTRMGKLHPVAMRMELKEGINNCIVINDSYNSDLGSLEIALDFLNQQKQSKKKVVVLSDILQSGKDEEVLYEEVAGLLRKKGVDRFMGIGAAIVRHASKFSTGGSFYPSTEDFLSKYSGTLFNGEIILLKGARQFGFEKISKVIEQKAHETVLEVNLNSIVNNLNVFRSRLNPDTQIMAMVKAFSYGSGSYEIANVLQFHHIDYLGVAYADSGIALRDSGILTPIMVMNPEEQSFPTMIKANLEPEIYNFRVLRAYIKAIKEMREGIGSGPRPIHIKLETGMHRLGFESEEIDQLISEIDKSKEVFIKSVFSHLAGSESSTHDDFTKHQIKKFVEIADKLRSIFDYPITRHILNSHGIVRFPDSQFEMVRLGIGIYGVSTIEDGLENKPLLENVSTLKSAISQVKTVPENDTIGYGRKGLANSKMTIAIVPIGYADGLNRKLGNGVGKLLINGELAPIVGDVCMDMCMLDISKISAKEGDEVIVFGEDYPVTEFAKNLDTIPYEVLTSISQRVKRIYLHE